MDDKKPPQAAASPPVSRRIRDRVVAAGERFHANDNIARFIEPEELPELMDEVEAKMRALL